MACFPFMDMFLIWLIARVSRQSRFEVVTCSKKLFPLYIDPSMTLCESNGLYWESFVFFLQRNLLWTLESVTVKMPHTGWRITSLLLHQSSSSTHFSQAYEEAATSEAFKKGKAVSEEVYCTQYTVTLSSCWMVQTSENINFPFIAYKVCQRCCIKGPGADWSTWQNRNLQGYVCCEFTELGVVASILLSALLRKQLTDKKLWSLQLWMQFLQLPMEAWEIQNFNWIWTCDLVILVWCSNQLSYEATDVGSWSNPIEVLNFSGFYSYAIAKIAFTTARIIAYLISHLQCDIWYISYIILSDKKLLLTWLFELYFNWK